MRPQCAHTLTVHTRTPTALCRIYRPCRFVLLYRRQRCSLRTLAGEAEGLDGDALRGDHVVHAVLPVGPRADHAGADAVAVTEGDHADTVDQDHRRETAAATRLDDLDGVEDVVGGDLVEALGAGEEAFGEDVEEDLRVGGGVDVAPRRGELLEELVRVGEVAVVARQMPYGVLV